MSESIFGPIPPRPRTRLEQAAAECKARNDAMSEFLEGLTDIILGDNPNEPIKRPIRLLRANMKIDTMFKRLCAVAGRDKELGNDPAWNALMDEIVEYAEVMRGGMETFFQTHPEITKYEKSI